MPAVFRWLGLATAGIALACGGSALIGGASQERSPAELPYAAAPPPPPPLTPAVWGGRGAKPHGERTIAAHTDPGELPELVLATDQSAKLPLEHTHVSAQLTGFVGEVEVRQTFKNPYQRPIEVVYLFPLPENSAVHEMRMQIGERVIESEVKERREARRVYDQAKRQGHTAALLEQQRPNVFTQSVANIEPGKKIDVVIRYAQDLSYDAGSYEFVFPMVVGPRYPGATPDAARISPPIVGKGERSGHDISLELAVDAGSSVGKFEVPTHEVVSRRPADGTLRLTLAEKDSLPNRDFLLRYRVASEQPRAVLYATSPDAGSGYFSLLVQPPELDVEALVGQRELIFVVDVSGSMSGTPLAICRRAMRDALARLRPVDSFDIVTFAGSSRRAFDAPRPANAANIAAALQLIDELQAGGGTEMLNAIETALSSQVPAGRHRYVFFLTDGYVGNEDEILDASARFVKALESKGQRARVFGFGVGSSVNRYLIEGLSRAGKGVSVYATPREDPSRAVNRFFHYVDRAVVTDLRIDWGALGASDVFPQQTPDLFASHPLILHGRYRGKLEPPVIRGRVGEQTVSIPASVRPAKSLGDPRRVFGALWARAKIGGLEQELAEGGAEARREITRLGIDFHLLTQFTSFVAVDRSKRIAGGTLVTVHQPVEEPEGVDVEMAGGMRAEDAPLMESGAGDIDPSPAKVLDARELHACGCRAPGRGSNSQYPLLALAALLALLRRRARLRLAPDRTV
jgi:Ca-activated chloride channel homolog